MRIIIKYIKNSHVFLVCLLLTLVLVSCAVSKEEKRVTRDEFIQEQILLDERKWASPEEVEQIDSDIDSLHYKEKLEFDPAQPVLDSIFDTESNKE